MLLNVFNSLKRTGSYESFGRELDYAGGTVFNSLKRTGSYESFSDYFGRAIDSV